MLKRQWLFALVLVLVQTACAPIGETPTPKKTPAPCDTCQTDEFCLKDACVACKPGATRVCKGDGKGQCGEGKETCSDKGAWGTCVAQTKAQVETCNGKDDDCDGEVDNNAKQVGTSCKGADTSQQGSCAEGMYHCQRGALVCVQNKSKAELCNGVDDDCDGQIDNPSRVCPKTCKFPFHIPTPTIDRHSNDHTIYLVLDPDTGDICDPKKASRALYLNVSWDRHHGFRRVLFEARSGWSIRSLSAPRADTNAKNYPYEHSDVRVGLKSPSGKYFVVLFDWRRYTNVIVHSIKAVSAL